MSIETLIPDIYSLLTHEDRSWADEHFYRTLSESVARSVTDSLRVGTQGAKLRLSQMGPRCPRALWYSIHHPELAEPLPPWAKIKFTYGHILEALVVCLVRAAGHQVEGEQDEIILDGVVGHRDCIIDGCIVDIKSASSIAFDKFKNGEIKENDSFGYLDQLDGYVVGSVQDPLVTCKDKGYLLAIDKTKGHMCLYEHKIREISIKERIRNSKVIVARDTPPPCECETKPDGASGNIRLDTRASYSAFKHCCFPELRTFIYSNGPRYLSRVIRKPDVPELDKEGRLVYNS